MLQGGQGGTLGPGEVIMPLLSAVMDRQSQGSVGEGNRVGGEKVETGNARQSSKKRGCEWRETRVAAEGGMCDLCTWPGETACVHQLQKGAS